MWVRNGHQIRGQAMTYIQSHFCKSTIDVDIYLLQVTIYSLLTYFKYSHVTYLALCLRYSHSDGWSFCTGSCPMNPSLFYTVTSQSMLWHLSMMSVVWLFHIVQLMSFLWCLFPDNCASVHYASSFLVPKRKLWFLGHQISWVSEWVIDCFIEYAIFSMG